MTSFKCVLKGLKTKTEEFIFASGFLSFVDNPVHVQYNKWKQKSAKICFWFIFYRSQFLKFY